MDVKINPVFLNRVLFKPLDTEFFNQFTRSGYAIQEADNLLHYFFPCFRIKILEGPAVQEIHQNFGHIIENPYNRISLQAEVIAIKQSFC